MVQSRREAPWYAGGLRFSCHRCNHCCRGGQEGQVYVTRSRIEKISRFLELPEREFRQNFVTADVGGDTVLRLQPNGDCIFWKDGCSIYSVRPRQCRTFPFWGENLTSREEWTQLKTFCHGIDEGRLYPLSEIRAVFHGRATGSTPTTSHPREKLSR